MATQIAFATVCSLTNTGWTATGGTAVQCLLNSGDVNYCSAAIPVTPPATGTLIATNFGFSIPAGSTSISVAFYFDYKTSGAVPVAGSLTLDGVNAYGWSGGNKSATWSQTGVGPYTNLTAAQINASTFGLMFDPGGTGTVYASNAYIVVTYVPSNFGYAGSGTLGIAGGSSYFFHSAAGVNAYPYSGTGALGIVGSSTYIFGSGGVAPPFKGVMETSSLYSGQIQTKG